MRNLLAITIVVLATSFFGCAEPNSRCALVPVQNNAIEALAGKNAARVFEPQFGGILENPIAEARMKRIGSRLAGSAGVPENLLQYHLLDSEKLNAASLPVGRIYITKALYARLESDDLLAAVMAHELAHLVYRDCFKPRCKTLDESLQRELAADAFAARHLELNGFDRDAMLGVIRIIKPAQPQSWHIARSENLGYFQDERYSEVAGSDSELLAENAGGDTDSSAQADERRRNSQLDSLALYN